MRFAPARHAPALLLLACFAGQAFRSSRVHSNAYDELAYVGAGYSYVAAGRCVLDVGEHPPLYKALAGLALAPLRLPMPEHLAWDRESAYQFGQRLVYNSGVDPMKILAWARGPNLFCAVLLGLAVYSFALELFGWEAALGALAFYSFEPTLIDHASFLSLDLGVAFFGFLALWLYERHSRRPDRRFLAASAAALAAGLLTKISAVLFIPAIAAAALARGRSRRDLASWGLGSLALTAAVLACAGLLPTMARSLVYRAGQIGGWDPGDLPTNFLMGRTKPGGFFLYYVVALGVKSPLPLLIATAVSVVVWRDLDKTGRRSWPWLAFPAAAFLLAGSLSQKQYGIRYALPVYPFLCVAAGALAATRRRELKALAVALLLWHAAEGAFAGPHDHAYFNEIAGGSNGGSRWLADSSLDWGQDMPALRAYLHTQGSPEAISLLATDADLDHWIGPHQDLLADPLTARRPYAHVNSDAPRRELLLASAMFRAGWGLSDPKAFSWLEGLKPVATFGGGTFVYDVTNDAWAQNRMGLLYYRLRQWPLALRQCRRAAALAPGNPAVYAAWADVYQAMGDAAGARRMRARASSPLPRPRP